MNLRSAARSVLHAWVCVGAILICSCATKADTVIRDDDIRMTNVRTVISAMQRAKSIRISAWVLSDQGELSRALRRAAARGADVRVVLDGVPTHSIAATNFKTARILRASAVDVTLTDAPLHAKLALIDDVAYLTDRNWTTNSRAEIVLRDIDATDRQVVAAAMDGKPSSDARFSTRKADALRLEAALIRSVPSATISVETEAFTGGSPIDAALVSQAAVGAKIRLIVDRREYRKSARERTTLASLAQRGIVIRTGRSGEKMAIVNNRAWVGSANATPGTPEQIDWGMLVPEQLVASVNRSFERNWRAAHPISGADVDPGTVENVNIVPVTQ